MEYEWTFRKYNPSLWIQWKKVINTKNSKSFIDFITILCEFDNLERKLFLKFVTGCPTLPIGGFKNLNPKITVVKKLSDS